MKKKITRLVIAALIAGTLGVIVYRFVIAQRADPAAQGASTAPAAVVVAQPERRDLVERVVFTGEIRPRNEVNVISKLAGGVEQILVEVGDSVNAGQLLAVIEHREIELQNRQAKAQVKVAKAALEQARTNLEYARKQLKKFEALSGGNAVSQSEFEQVEASFKGAETAVSAAEAQLEQARAAAGLAGEALRSSRITSPISGVVVKKLIDVGAQTGPGQPIFQVQDNTELKLIGTVAAEDFARLHAGQPARISVDSIPGKEFKGIVATLSPSLDPTSRRASVEIVVEDKEGRLLPNMFAVARVDVGRRSGVLSVPAGALVAAASGSGKLIYVVRGGMAVAVKLPPTAGEQEFVSVESVLSEADRVVVSGQGTLADGAPVKIVKGGPPERSQP